MPAALLLAAAVLAPDPLPQEPAEAPEADAGIVARVKAAVGEKGAEKPFVLVVTMTAKQGQTAELVKAYRAAATKSKAEPGCTAYNLHRDAEDPRKFLLYERWKTPAALASHLEADYTKTFVGRFGDLLEDSGVTVMKAVPARRGPGKKKDAAEPETDE